MRRTIEQVTPDQVAAGVSRVRALVREAADRSGRSVDDVALVAAVKYVDASGCELLTRAGIEHLAENRLDALVAKQEGLGPGAASAAGGGARPTWHFIGRLQSRDVVDIAPRVAWIHSLCTASAARRLDAWADRTGAPVPRVLVQVNVDGDPAKDGLAPALVERFLDELPESIVVRGFMAMPAFAADAEQSRPAFASLRELRDELAPRFAGRHELRELSMGTSEDIAVAVEEGSTFLRLGRILYGDVE